MQWAPHLGAKAPVLPKEDREPLWGSFEEWPDYLLALNVSDAEFMQ
jgi:hypothetical protein